MSPELSVSYSENNDRYAANFVGSSKESPNSFSSSLVILLLSSSCATPSAV